MLQLIKTFLRGVWVSNSELLDVYIRTENNIYIVDNESQISHCQRKKLQIRKGEGWDEPFGTELELKVSV